MKSRVIALSAISAAFVALFLTLAAEKGAEFITVFYGDGISEADAQHAEQRFIDACPEAEVSLLPGGQPVYYYIISIE